MKTIPVLIGLGVVCLVVWSMTKGKAAAAATGTTVPEALKLGAKATVRTVGDITTVTPPVGSPAVTPYPGAEPVIPQAVVIPKEAIISPFDQIKVFNPYSLLVAWTRRVDLPNMLAGGWIIMTEAE